MYIQRQASLSTLQSRSARRKVDLKSVPGNKNRRKGTNTEDEENDVNSEKFKALVSDNKETNNKKKMSKEKIDLKEFPNGKKPSIEDNNRKEKARTTKL